MKKLLTSLFFGVSAGLIVLLLNVGGSYVMFGQLPAPSVPFFNQVPFSVNNTFTGAGTVTAQQLTGILFAIPGSGGATMTTDTATNICALFPAAGAQGGGRGNYIFYLQSAGGTTTLAGGTGVTVTGTSTVGSGQIKPFVGIMACPPGTTAAVNYVSLGTSTY